MIPESEQKFRSLADESPNMIFINRRGTIAYVNDRCSELMGYSKEEFYDDDFDFFSIIAPESMNLVKAAYAAHQGGQDVPPYEYALVKKDGGILHVILNSLAAIQKQSVDTMTAMSPVSAFTTWKQTRLTKQISSLTIII